MSFKLVIGEQDKSVLGHVTIRNIAHQYEMRLQRVERSTKLRAGADSLSEGDLLRLYLCLCEPVWRTSRSFSSWWLLPVCRSRTSWRCRAGAAAHGMAVCNRRDARGVGGSGFSLRR